MSDLVGEVRRATKREAFGQERLFCCKHLLEGMAVGGVGTLFVTGSQAYALPSGEVAVLCCRCNKRFRRARRFSGDLESVRLLHAESAVGRTMRGTQIVLGDT